MTFTTEEILIFLQIAVFVLLLVLLYHLIFAAVSLRRVLKRADNVTDQVEQVMLKPISIADTAVDWMAGFLEGAKKGAAATKKSSSKKK